MSVKHLYLLRHAKAVPAEAVADDHERPLAERGERDAAKLGAFLRDAALPPQLVLCSTSLRTRQTLHALEKALGAPLTARFESGLYLASPQDVLEVVHAVEPKVRSLMLIGHNPTLHQLAVDLHDGTEDVMSDDLARRFPTCTLAELQFNAEEWSELEYGACALRKFLAPNMLAEA